MKSLSKKCRNKLLIASVAMVVILGIIGGAFLYISDYMSADSYAIEAFSADYDVAVSEPEKGVMVFGDGDEQYGFIFYPGGKVEYTAYAPLMRAISSRGILCVLLEMPGNLAVLDVNAADGIFDMYPRVESWYIGGHSLGGAMAASYLSSHGDAFDGLVLLAAYSTKEISDDLRVLSVYGSEDGVMNSEKYEKYRGNLPAGFNEVVIEGGCHAYFGMYGSQKGDGVPTISNAEQIEKTAALISEMIGKGDSYAQDN